MQYLQARPFVLLTFLIIFLALTSTGCPRRPSEQSGEPAAAFTADITEGVAPLQVQFTDNSTLNKDDSITGWNWNFGDGATSVEQHPQHVFTEQGSYSITLTVTSSAGKSGTLAKENFIVVQAPIENPEGEEYIVPPSLETVILFDNTNLADVSAMPQQELYIEFQTPVKIDTITTEHIVTEETFSTHAITLTEESGSSYGPFQAHVVEDGGEGSTALFETDLRQEIPAGIYLVTDSSPETWANNVQSENAGFTIITGTMLPTGALQNISTTGGAITAEGMSIEIPAGTLQETSSIQVSMDAPGYDGISARYVLSGEFPVASGEVTVKLGLSSPPSSDWIHIAMEVPVLVSGEQIRNSRFLFPAAVDGLTATAEVPAPLFFDSIENTATKQPLKIVRSTRVVYTVEGNQVFYQTEHFKGTVDKSLPNWGLATDIFTGLEDAWYVFEEGSGHRLNFDKRTERPIEVYFCSFGGDPENAEWGFHTPGWTLQGDKLDFNTDKIKLNQADAAIHLRSTAFHELFHLLQNCYYRADKNNNFMNEAMCTFIEWEETGYTFRPDSLSPEYLSRMPVNGILRPMDSAVGNYSQHGYALASFVAYMHQYNNKFYTDYLADILLEYAKTFSAVNAFAAAYVPGLQGDYWNRWFPDFVQRHYSGMIYQGDGSSSKSLIEDANSSKSPLEVWTIPQGNMGPETHAFETELHPLAAKPMIIRANGLPRIPVQVEITSSAYDPVTGLGTPEGMEVKLCAVFVSSPLYTLSSPGGKSIIYPRLDNESSVYSNTWTLLFTNFSTIAGAVPVTASIKLTPAVSFHLDLGENYPSFDVRLDKTENRNIFNITQTFTGFVTPAGGVAPITGLNGQFSLIEESDNLGNLYHRKCQINADWTKKEMWASGNDFSEYSGSGTFMFSGAWPPAMQEGLLMDGTGSGQSTVTEYKLEDGTWKPTSSTHTLLSDSCALKPSFE